MSPNHNARPKCVLRCAGAVVEKQQLTATVGDRVTLPCFSDNKYNKLVDWRYRGAPDAVDEYVWNRKYLVNGYKTRCTIETRREGQYNLVIFRVRLNDTGFYDCVERGGFGKRHRIRLDVLPPNSEFSPATFNNLKRLSAVA